MMLKALISSWLNNSKPKRNRLRIIYMNTAMPNLFPVANIPQTATPYGV
jgi:hypothetical protein